jgi:hypothetical protein
MTGEAFNTTLHVEAKSISPDRKQKEHGDTLKHSSRAWPAV